MTVQDDINAAASTLAQATAALQAASVQVGPASTSVALALQPIQAAIGQILAGQSVDVLGLAQAYKTANDAYMAVQASLPGLQSAVDAATLALAELLAPQLGVTSDQVVAVLNSATATATS